ncbi:hypothetical protein BH10ACI4_BH10ACI4_37480 [soil metagenome]
MWPDAVRGGPNVLLRSAFFAGIKSGKRRTLGTQTSPDREPEGVEIAAQDGVSIKYAGTQLNQYDADVFFEALHLSRRSSLGIEAVFSGASFLASIGRSRNNLNYEDLDNSLRRLKRGVVDVCWNVGTKRYVYCGSLIASYTRETQSKLYRIRLSPEIRTLFAPASWTQIEWEERRRLMGKPLAQWLHSYFCTHARPYPVSVGFLKEKTGSPTKLLKHFKTELRSALRSMSELIGWDVEFNGDLVSVRRPPTRSQARHLSKIAARRKARSGAEKRLLTIADPESFTRLAANGRVLG